jgi:TPP-dependent pyruvate/acetoin dehydrogenase alpha subunit
MKKARWAQDCVLRTEQLILENNWADADTLKKWREKISAEVEKAVETAQREAAPVGSEEDWCAVSTREMADGTGQ